MFRVFVLFPASYVMPCDGIVDTDSGAVVVAPNRSQSRSSAHLQRLLNVFPFLKNKQKHRLTNFLCSGVFLYPSLAELALPSVAGGDCTSAECTAHSYSASDLI